MRSLLRQSTAATIPAGPLLDIFDATPETALVPAIYVSKNGSALALQHGAVAAVHDALGYYTVALDATDTGTCGRLRMVLSAIGALSCWEDFMVVPAAIYDALIGTDITDGKTPVVYTVTINGVPEQGVLCEFFSDSGKTTRVAYAITNAVGQTPTIRLDSGTYYIRNTKPGKSIPDDIEVVP